MNLPTSEKINELIISNIDKLKSREIDPFNLNIIIDIKDQFYFESNMNILKCEGLIYDADFSDFCFRYQECEEDLIFVIEENTKIEIINQLNKL